MYSDHSSASHTKMSFLIADEDKPAHNFFPKKAMFYLGFFFLFLGQMEYSVSDVPIKVLQERV